jgi:energy-coupling factor transporter ATP-binding protein EcfA2
MVVDPATGLVALETAAKIYRLAEDEKVLTRLANFFKSKDTIIVLGSTGSGKTNLLESLGAAAALVEPIPAITRTQTPERRKVVVNERPFTIIDTPGQKAHAAQRQELYRAGLAKPPVRVINVVSYGYHEYATGSGEALDGQGSPSSGWLERHRANELTAMREWLPLLGDRNTTSWILTAITKADLWWNEHDAVVDYYENGSYAEELRRQDSGLKHSVLPYSSVFHRFYGEAPLAGTFDDEDRLQTTTHFLRQLATLG